MIVISRRHIFLILYALGASAGLAFELIWIRQMSVIWGGSVLSTCLVFAAVMGGFGLGAWQASLRAANIQEPRRAYAQYQILGALLCWLPGWTSSLSSFGAIPLGILSIALASYPLGWLFPLAVRLREEDAIGKDSSAGRLYAADTAGATAGCLFAGLLSISLWGLMWSMVLFSGLKVLSALSVLLLPKKSSAILPAPACVCDPAPSTVRWAMLFLVFLQGFVLLGAENLWYRLLAFSLYRGSTTYAATALLASVLVSMALGAFWVGKFKGSPNACLRLGLRWSLGCALSLWASYGILCLAAPTPSQVPVSIKDLLVTLLVVGPSSFCSGAIFSLACQSRIAGVAALSSAQALLVNTIGASMGSVATPLVLISWLGLGASVLLLGVLLFAAAFWLMVQNQIIKRRWLLLPIALVLAWVAFGLLGQDQAGFWARRLGHVLFYEEGREASVAVVERPPGVKRLYVDGVAVAGTDLAMLLDQKSLAHVPLFLHPEPTSALTIGFGSGGTSYSMLLHPNLQVDCAEISPSIPKAAPYLKESNHGFDLSAPGYRLILQDARRLLATDQKHWDVIVNDCTDLAYRSDASLYSRDFFLQVRQHLNPQGIAAAWIPMRGDPPYRVLRSVIATFGSVFPNISLWLFDNSPNHFAILVGAMHAPVVDLERMRLLLAQPAIALDLAQVGLDDPWRLALSRFADDAALRAFANSTDLHTDDRPVVEFWAPWETGDDASGYLAIQAVGSGSLPPPVIHQQPKDPMWLGERLAARPWLLAGHLAYLQQQEEQARLYYIRALRLSPADPAPKILLGLASRGEESKQDKSKQGVERLWQGQAEEAVLLLSASGQDPVLSLGNLLALGWAQLYAGEASKAQDNFIELLQKTKSEPFLQKARLGAALADLPAMARKFVLTLTLVGL